MDKKLVSQSLKFGRILTSPIRRMPNFLELLILEPKQYQKLNFDSYRNVIDFNTREKLIDYHKPHNNRLY